MDAAELAAAARKALEFTHAIGDCEFTLRTPTRLEVRECLYRNKLKAADGDMLLMSLLQRYLLNAHVVGWTGVRIKHVLPGGASDPLPWAAGTVPVLLDAQPGWADELGGALMVRMHERNAEIEEQAGN